MPLLKHQIILHPDLVGQFALDKPVTPWARRVGFSWYLCPVIVAGDPQWLLANAEFGYCRLVNALEKAFTEVEQAALNAIESHLPDKGDGNNVSVSFDTEDITWHTANKIPEHVGLRYQAALKSLGKCKDTAGAKDALEKLNNTPLTIDDRTFAPAQGLEGLLEELAENFSHYIKTTPWWKLQWHLLTRQTPWMD